MSDGIVVGQNILVGWVDGLAFLDERTLELLLLETLLCKPMNWHEGGVSASNWTFLLIFNRLLLNPLGDALTTECRLTFLAFLGVKQDLEANLADEELLKSVAHDVSRT